MRSLLASILVAGLLLATGCSHGGDPPAVADPTRTPATSPSIRTGPVAPALPAAARRPTKAGAIAFAKYYWAVANYAMASLDTQRLTTLATAECGQCAGAANWIRDVRQAGGRIVGGASHILSAEASLLHGTRSRWLVELRSREDRSHVVGAGPRLDRTYPEARATDLMVLIFADSGWKVASWKSR
ncbi:MAG: DUF6318 family protein [Nocardioidaceae bacterium]|nr:DUF6318 family protein [Nocardioidaceae bacterium]